MCFTSGPTSDRSSSYQSDGLRSKLLMISGPKLKKSKLSASRRSSSSVGVKTAQTVAKVAALAEKDPRSRTAFNRLGSPADISEKDNTGTMTAIVSRNGVQSGTFAIESENFSKQDKKFLTAGQLVSKIKTKQMKGMITGVGKELRRAANTVGGKLPGQKKKHRREEKERQELLGEEPKTPQARNPDEIKKAYGYAGDTRQAASIVHDKLRERGEKLSAIQRRTTELEGDAAHFASLTQDLVKKIECKKWYEI